MGRKTEITNLLANLPRLGAGLSYRRPFRDELLQRQSEVDFIEIIGDFYLDAPPEKLDELALLMEHFTVIPHFTTLSLGSAEGLEERHLEKIYLLLKRIAAPWWSEHIGYTRAGGINLGHPSPLPFTKEAVETMARNIITARRAIATPLILENVCSPLIWPGAEMTEPAFIAQVLHHSGCGLLLDVTNIHANSTNHGASPAEFIEQLPLERVVQVHFSGAHESKGRLVDSRTQSVPESIWQLLDLAVSRAPVRCICLERDDNLPPLPEMLWEVERARALGRLYKRWN